MQKCENKPAGEQIFFSFFSETEAVLKILDWSEQLSALVVKGFVFFLWRFTFPG